jgi:hypothetical protein
MKEHKFLAIHFFFFQEQVGIRMQQIIGLDLKIPDTNLSACVKKRSFS